VIRKRGQGTMFRCGSPASDLGVWNPGAPGGKQVLGGTLMSPLWDGIGDAASLPALPGPSDLPSAWSSL
jgi:hypothetical protein